MRYLSNLLIVLFFFSFSSSANAQDIGVGNADDINNILPIKDRVEVQNDWLKWRLENILPEVMEREGIDLWVVINREYNEDPVYLSMVPRPTMAARRTSILVFHSMGNGKVDRYTGSFYGMGEWYKSVYTDKKADQFEEIAKLIKRLDPNKIALNFSEMYAFGDGISWTHKEMLKEALGKDLSKRIVSGVRLAVGWLEKRSPAELSVYRHITGIAHDIIKEFYSNEVIVPDITTVRDVEWWIRQKIVDIGLKTWFQPSVDIQRSPEEAKKYSDKNLVIRRGDVLHCDIGIVYLGLATDTQELAYVLREGETDVPDGLKKALKNANRVQDIFMGYFKEGRTGNEVLKLSLDKARSEGLKASIYSHPLGFHGHAAGPTLGMWDNQNGTPGRGDYELFYETAYSIELGNRTNIPEWDNFEVNIPLEEDASFTKRGCVMLDGRQEKFYIIK